jgi:two-component system cell cycle response regulator CtrA
LIIARILVVEPDRLTRRLLCDVLSPYFDVVTIGAEPIIAPGAALDFDLIITEPNAPTSARDFGLIRALRAAAIATPVMILSAVADPPLIAQGLRAGADEYMSKPFHRDELLARIRAVLRRAEAAAPAPIRVGSIEIDRARQIVRVAGDYVHFTAKEFAMLELLALRKGAVVTQEMLMTHLYGGMDEAQPKIVQVFICKIRHKLGAAALHVVSHWGRGYALCDAPPADSAPLERALAVVHQVRPGPRGQAAAAAS